MNQEIIKEPMSKVDTAWLRMEHPSNLMMINGVIFLGANLDYERLLQTIEERFLTFRRFTQKVTDGAAGAHWVTEAGGPNSEPVVPPEPPAPDEEESQPAASSDNAKSKAVREVK